MNRAGIGSLMGESGRTMSDDVKLAKMDRRIADLGASQGMAPATQRMMLIKKTAADMGKIISEEDAKLFGAGEISFQDAMSRATPIPRSGAMAMQQPNAQLQMAAGDEVSLTGKMGGGPTPEYADYELPESLADRTYYEKLEIQELLSGMASLATSNSPRRTEANNYIPMLEERTGLSRNDPEFGKMIQFALKRNIDKGISKFAEGGEASIDEVQSSLNELQEQQPEIDAMNQLIASVVEMVMSGVSEEEIMQFLSSKGLDDEEIQMVLEAVAEQLMQQQGGIQEELSALG